MLRNLPSIPSFSESFYNERVLAFVNAFSVSTEMTVFFFFPSTTVIYYIHFSLMLNPCISIVNSALSWYIILLMCLIWFASILLRIFALIFITD